MLKITFNYVSHVFFSLFILRAVCAIQHVANGELKEYNTIPHNYYDSNVDEDDEDCLYVFLRGRTKNTEVHLDFINFLGWWQSIDWQLKSFDF